MSRLWSEHDQYLLRVQRRRFDASVPTVVLEDACARAWTLAWIHRDRVREENPVGWLVTVARREVLAELRHRRVEVSESPAAAAHTADLEVAFEARQCLELMIHLRPNQRVALGLRAAGFSYREIAERTGKTCTWTNRHLTDGRARLARSRS